MAASPLTADTDSGLTAPEQFARRQLVQHGSAYLGKEMTKAGLAAIAYGSQPIDLKRTSHLMPRGSSGERSLSPRSGTKYKSPRNNRWGANYETDVRSKTGTTRPSSRTSLRSPVIRGTGTLLVIGGRIVPILGVAWALHDLATYGKDSETYELYDQQDELLNDFGESIVPSFKATLSMAKTAAKIYTYSQIGLNLFD